MTAPNKQTSTTTKAKGTPTNVGPAPTHWVELTRFPADRMVATIKIVRKFTDSKLIDVKAMCEQLPARFTVENILVAAAVKAELEAIGAEVQVISHTEDCHTARVTPTVTASEAQPAATGYVEPAAETAAMHLRQVRAILDLMQTLARSKDVFADIDTLFEDTLDNALDAAIKHIEAAEELTESWPRVSP